MNKGYSSKIILRFDHPESEFHKLEDKKKVEGDGSSKCFKSEVISSFERNANKKGSGYELETESENDKEEGSEPNY